MRFHVELETLDFNPCLMVRRLPENQRDTYLSWKDFNRLLERSWWIRDILVMMYYTGMRFGEVVESAMGDVRAEAKMRCCPRRGQRGQE